MAKVADDINVRVGDEFIVAAKGIAPRDVKLHKVGFLEQTHFSVRPDRSIEFGFIATEEGLHTVAIFKGADRHHLQIINAYRSEI